MNRKIKSFKKVKRLDNSLIYHISLGSKELFHSNFWEYLIKNDHQFIKVFFNDFDFNKYIDEKIKVYREKSNRDLVINLVSREGIKEHLVIENKIKSLPSIEQLESYSKNLEGYKFIQGVLTGIGENILDFSKSNTLNGKWNYIDYSLISKRIKLIARRSKVKSIKDNLKIINEYCEVVNLINSLLNFYLFNSINKLDYSCDYGDEKLSSLRLDDIYKKLKASNFLSYIKKNLTYENENMENSLLTYHLNNYELIIRQGFSHKNPIVDIYFSNVDHKIIDDIGIQLQGSQFRIVVSKDVKEIKEADTLYAKYKNTWFDDSFDSELSRAIYGYKTSMKPKNNKKYDSFSKDYIFIYQYFNIDKSNYSYEKLLNLIKEFINKASEVIKENSLV